MYVRNEIILTCTHGMQYSSQICTLIPVFKQAILHGENNYMVLYMCVSMTFVPAPTCKALVLHHTLLRNSEWSVYKTIIRNQAHNEDR